MVTAEHLTGVRFPAGSMGPKVYAACAFARRLGTVAVIGAHTDIAVIAAGTAGAASACTPRRTAPARQDLRRTNRCQKTLRGTAGGS
ncbi:hypothetical protein [Mycobacterium sp. GA-2829]|uniref:hypothetical protein n=1 Tax=Mycobacterium sp. GA-2829 TaxID=1772283 RepID=UPI00073FFA29|nr:hypothetical protein [Mycobacterium sp. GA-2829]KUI32628.1 hypothetical protein AU194_25090 [Mycobacterium sp. GA-2829]